jgi:hypothetical protein
MDWTDLAQDRDQWTVLVNTAVYYIIYLDCKWVFTRWQWYNKTQHTNNTSHKITLHTQIKHSTKNAQTINDTLHTMNTITTTTTIKQIIFKNKCTIY